MRQYYAVHVRSGYETKVKEILLKKHSTELEKSGVKIFVSGYPGKGMQGYLIIGCRIWSDELYYLLKHTVGVISVKQYSIPRQEIYRYFKNLRLYILQEYLTIVKNLSRQKGQLRMLFSKIKRLRKVAAAVFPKRDLVLMCKPVFPLLN